MSVEWICQVMWKNLLKEGKRKDMGEIENDQRKINKNRDRAIVEKKRVR